jgi:hypothetical protein
MLTGITGGSVTAAVVSTSVEILSFPEFASCCPQAASPRQKSTAVRMARKRFIMTSSIDFVDFHNTF